MRAVYIAHRLGAGADREQNRAEAAKWVAWAALQGVAPVATRVTLAGEWDESRRDLGLAIDVALIQRCDEVWLCGPVVSAGMLVELEAAERSGVAVRRFEARPESACAADRPSCNECSMPLAEYAGPEGSGWTCVRCEVQS